MAQEISNVLVFYLCKNITNISFVIILLTRKCELPYVIEAWTLLTKNFKNFTILQETQLKTNVNKTNMGNLHLFHDTDSQIFG